MKSIITVQHTQARHHLLHMLGSRVEWPLTELGRRHADSIGRQLAPELAGFTLYCSPQLRARQTAQGIVDHTGLAPIFRSELREFDFGPLLEGRDKAWQQEHIHMHPLEPDEALLPGSETPRQLHARVGAFLEELLESGPEKILIVAHGASLQAFRELFVFGSYQEGSHCRLPGKAGGVCRLAVDDRGERSVLALNQIYF